MKKTFFILTSLIFFTLNILLGVKIYQNLDKFQRYKMAYTSELNFESSLLDIKDYISNNEWSSSKKESIDKIKKAASAKKSANFSGLLSGLSMVVYGLVFFFFFRKSKITIKQLGLVTLNISLVLLCIGITIPFIEIGAFMKDLKVDVGLGISKTFDGKMYFFYQCKSVLNLIQTLFESNNFVVAIAILLFSVLSPFTKLAFYYKYLLTKNSDQHSSILKVITYIGKYSMADVYVAACFLAFLSFSNLNVGVKTESSTLLGLYFFLGYCILSIGIYFLLIKKKSSNQSVVSLDN